jgi:D-xylose reductase
MQEHGDGLSMRKLSITAFLGAIEGQRLPCIKSKSIRVQGEPIISHEKVTLASGSKVPSVGLGLWKIDRSITAGVVQSSIDIGYRHFDAACDYGNEAEVGEGLAAAISSKKVRRDELWVTSKLWNTYHRGEHVRTAVTRTLSDLRLDYLDLYLVHFPISLAFVPFEHRYPPGWFHDPGAASPAMKSDLVPIRETWEAMQELVYQGLVREIGVSNFGTSLLRDLMSYAAIPPAMLRIELHPYLTQEKLLRFCSESGIAVAGFSPLGAQSYFSINMAKADEAVIEQPMVKSIAAKHKRTAAQVVMRWGIQRGTAIVPKSIHPDRLRENLNLFDFELSAEEMMTISGMNRNRRFNDPGDFGEAAFNTFYPIYE